MWSAVLSRRYVTHHRKTGLISQFALVSLARDCRFRAKNVFRRMKTELQLNHSQKCDVYLAVNIEVLFMSELLLQRDMILNLQIPACIRYRQPFCSDGGFQACPSSHLDINAQRERERERERKKERKKERG